MHRITQNKIIWNATLMKLVFDAGHLFLLFVFEALVQILAD